MSRRRYVRPPGLTGLLSLNLDEDEDDGFPWVTEDEDEDDDGVLPLTANFVEQRTSGDGAWALIYHKPLHETRWVLITHIHVKGIAVAYYDADPTFLPRGEKP